MSHGLLVILRYFLIALLWLFFLYAARMVIVDVRRSRRLDEAASSTERAHGVRSPFNLRVLEPKGRRGETFTVADEVTLGRSPACVVALGDDAYASTVHARVFTHDGAVFVEDLGSRNGTYVNEARIAVPTPLERGDLLRVGATVLELRR